MAALHVNGIRLYYEQHGDGEPILGIHGTSSSGLMWGQAVDGLAQLGRVIVYDDGRRDLDPRRPWRRLLGGVPRADQADVHRQRPAILAELNGGFLEADPAALATIEKPTLLVAGADSPEAFRLVTDELAAAIPNARTALVEGGHLLNPAHPAVIDFIRETLADQRSGIDSVGRPAREAHRQMA
jgi:pimeloyl-ACP methyl ester carboxylesterase